MERFQKVIYHKPVITAGIAFVIAASMIWIRQLGILQELELFAYDRYLQQRQIDQDYDPPVVLIRITEEDIQRYGYPIPDGLLVQILEILLPFNPATIGIDIFRDIPSVGRDRLRAVLKDNPQTVLIEKRLGNTILVPDLISDTNQVGFADLKQDATGVIRRGLLILWDANDQNRPYLSFGLTLALNYLQKFDITLSADPENNAFVSIGHTSIPRFQFNDGGYSTADDGGYQFLLDYGYGTRPFPSFTVSEVMGQSQQLNTIDGKVIIIGTTAPSVQDQHETPFSHNVNKPMFGIEIHAQVVDQLIRTALKGDAPIQTIDENYENGLILAFSLFGVILGVTIRSLWLLISTILVTAGFFIFFPYLVFQAGYWIPAAALSLVFAGSFFWGIAYIGLIERSELKMIRMLFGKFVDRKVAKDLWEHRDQFIHDGRPKPVKLTATVVLTDLKEYTAAAEPMDPTEVMEWLNSYISAMTRVVELHSGIVEDYAGDGIKATFGIPVQRDNKREVQEDAQNAVRCALSMGQQLSSINAQWKAQGLPLERIRIGICTGPVTAGSIGSVDRMAYVTIGDTVNIAARLESFDKEQFEQETAGSFRVLVDEATWHWLGPDFQTEFIGNHHLRGKKKTTKIFRVYALTDNTNEMEN